MPVSRFYDCHQGHRPNLTPHSPKFLGKIWNVLKLEKLFRLIQRSSFY